MMSFIDNNKSDIKIENAYFELKSPMKGKTVPLINVPDEVFSKKMLGEGIAIIPSDSENTVYSPCKGKVTEITESKHAICIQAENGAEIIIHIGLDTVNLGGENFELLVKKGANVSQGQKIVKIDSQAIKEKGYNLITPVIITNYDQYSEFAFNENDVVTLNDTIIRFN